MAQAFAAIAIWLFVAFAASAQTPDKLKPAWGDLTAGQRQILAPLEKEWPKLDVQRRRKWIAFTDRFLKMKPDEQKRVQERMVDWANFKPEERRVVRERFKALSKLPPDKRQSLIKSWSDSQEAQQSPAAEADRAAATEPEKATPTEAADPQKSQ
jgi:hypothetical protein